VKEERGEGRGAWDGVGILEQEQGRRAEEEELEAGRGGCVWQTRGVRAINSAGAPEPTTKKYLTTHGGAGFVVYLLRAWQEQSREVAANGRWWAGTRRELVQHLGVCSLPSPLQVAAVAGGGIHQATPTRGNKHRFQRWTPGALPPGRYARPYSFSRAGKLGFAPSRVAGVVCQALEMKGTRLWTVAGIW